jgi:hypothetical protein
LKNIHTGTGRGGARPGAGRKAGTPNKASDARQARIAAEGKTPLDFMLEVMRDETKEFSQRLDMAKAAAPYVHPRLSSVEQKLDATVEGEVTLIQLVGPE